MKDHNMDTDKVKALLRGVVWDYNIGEDDLLKIFLDGKTGHSVNKADLQSRLLGYYNWHLLIKVLGFNGAQSLLNDEAISRVFPKSYQERLYGLQKILSGIPLSPTG